MGAGVPDPGVRPTPSPQVGSGSPQTQPKTGGLVGKAGDAASALVDSLNPFSNVEDSLTAVRAWVSNRHNWVRVAWVFGGGCMFAAGVIMIGGKPASKAASTVVQAVVPAGKALKAARKAT